MSDALAATGLTREQIERLVTMDPEFWWSTIARASLLGGGFQTGLKANIMQKRVFSHYRQCQKYGRPCLIQILKPRRKGASTVAEAVCYHHMRKYPELRGTLMGNRAATSDKVFEMFRTFAKYDRYPWPDGKPAFAEGGDLTDKIVLSNGSEFGKETAGSASAGRSTGVQVFHGDEVAFFQDTTTGRDPMTAAMPTFFRDSPMSLGFVTSTPNGLGNWFADTWFGQNEWFKIFQAWFDFEDSVKAFNDPDHRAHFIEKLQKDEKAMLEMQRYKLTWEQMHWRQDRIDVEFAGDVDSFTQEYPSDAISCLTAETRVGTNAGMLRIADVEPGMVSDHGTIVAKKMVGVRPIFNLRTRRGYRVRGTGDHRMALANGEFVHLSESLGREILLQPPVLSQSTCIVKWEDFGGVRSHLEIDERWAAFLGYYMGDGSLHGDTLDAVCDGRDTDLIAKLIELQQGIFGVPFSQRKCGTKGGGINIRAGSKRFSPLFKYLGIVRPYAPEENQGRQSKAVRRKVCVPECIWRSPRPIVREFLRWLFEADGWASKDVSCIKMFSKYVDFISDVQVLLLAFGVTSTIRAVTRTLNGKEFPGNELALTSREAALYQREIGFVSARKSDNFAAHYYPQPGGRRASQIATCDTVVSIEPAGEEEVWDIQIDGEAPVFSANGLLVHNCFLGSASIRFDATALQAMHLETEQRDKEGQRGVIRLQGEKKAVFLPDGAGDVRVWEEPKIGCRYVLAVDTCRGKDQQMGQGSSADPDWHSAQVWRAAYTDGQTGTHHRAKLVAHHHSRIEADVLAEVATGLAWFYGNCLTIPELNDGAGFYLVKELCRRRLNVFRREPMRMQKPGISTEDEKLEAFGWNTDKATKKWIIDSLAPLVRDRQIDFSDMLLQSEFETFVRNKHGQCQAMTGKHDDCVMAAAIALYNIGAATEFRPLVIRSVDLMRLARDSRYMAGRGWSRG